MNRLPLLLAIALSAVFAACAGQTVTGGIGGEAPAPAQTGTSDPSPVVRTIAETPAPQPVPATVGPAKAPDAPSSPQPAKASVAETVGKKMKIRLGSKKPPPPAGTMRPDGTYALSDAELAMNCKKLTGRTIVRILQIRDYELSQKTSAASRHMQQVATPVFGGSTFGADPDADYRRDRAAVEAYNRRLGEMKCKVFDLVKELQPRPAAETPVPAKK